MRLLLNFHLLNVSENYSHVFSSIYCLDEYWSTDLPKNKCTPLLLKSKKQMVMTLIIIIFVEYLSESLISGNAEEAKCKRRRPIRTESRRI